MYLFLQLHQPCKLFPIFPDMKKNLKKLRSQLDEIELLIPRMSEKNVAVSAAPVAWHLSHSLKVIYNVLGSLENSEPSEFKKKFNFKRLLIFTTGKIPRGKVRAPSAVVPDADQTSEKLEHHLQQTRSKTLVLENLPKMAFFDHPFFDHLNRDQTTKFLVIHTEHHLKIARDIIRS